VRLFAFSTRVVALGSVIVATSVWAKPGHTPSETPVPPRDAQSSKESPVPKELSEDKKKLINARIAAFVDSMVGGLQCPKYSESVWKAGSELAVEANGTVVDNALLLEKLREALTWKLHGERFSEIRVSAKRDPRGVIRDNDEYENLLSSTEKGLLAEMKEISELFNEKIPEGLKFDSLSANQRLGEMQRLGAQANNSYARKIHKIYSERLAKVDELSGVVGTSCRAETVRKAVAVNTKTKGNSASSSPSTPASTTSPNAKSNPSPNPKPSVSESTPLTPQPNVLQAATTGMAVAGPVGAALAAAGVAVAPLVPKVAKLAEQAKQAEEAQKHNTQTPVSTPAPASEEASALSKPATPVAASPVESPSPLPHSEVQQAIDAVISSTKCTQIIKLDRGSRRERIRPIESSGFRSGLFGTFARSFCRESSDAFRLKMASAAPANSWSGEKARSEKALERELTDYLSLPHYRNKLTKLQSQISAKLGQEQTPEDYSQLVMLYATLLESGVAESDGIVNKGNFAGSGVTAEAGMFQISANTLTFSTREVTPLLNQLVTQYKLAWDRTKKELGQRGDAATAAAETVCGTMTYTQDRSQRNARTAALSSIEGAFAAVNPEAKVVVDANGFQRLMKSCPNLATEYAALMLRGGAGHKGPLRRSLLGSADGGPNTPCANSLIEIQKVLSRPGACESLRLSDPVL